MALFSKKSPAKAAPAPKPAAEPETTAPEANAPQATAAGVASVIVADLALRAGRAMIDQVVSQKVMRGPLGKLGKGRIVRTGSLGRTVVATAATALARRSVPGAIVVGGVMLARALQKRRREKAAAAKPTDPKTKT